MTPDRLIRPLVLVAALAVAAAPAVAQPTAEQVARAQRLFDEGRDLIDAGRAGEACPKFEESQRLDPGRGTLINLAACYESVGKLASALRAFREVVEQSRAAGDKKRLDAAAARARALEARVPHLTIVVGDEPRPDGFAITLDGVPIALAEAGDVLVDPGRLVVAASAPGFEPFDQELMLQPDGRRTTVAIPALAPAADDGDAFAPDRPAPPSPVVRKDRDRVVIGLAAAGAGVLAIGGSTILALGAKSSYDDALAMHCGGDPAACSPLGFDRTSSARGRGNVATAVGVVGLAAVVAGVVVYVTAPTEEVRPRAAQLVPAVSADAAGVALVGEF